MKDRLWIEPRGQDLAEFAVTALFLLTLIMGIFDMGRAVIYYTSLQNAVREGARYGIVHGGSTEAEKDRDGVKARVVEMAVGLGSDFDVSDVTIVQWNSDVIQVQATYTFTPVTPVVAPFLPEDSLGNRVVHLTSSSTMRVEY